MKITVLTILIVLVGLPILAQEEVHLPPAVLAAGGSSDGSSTNLSLWRLSMIHTITLSGDFSTEDRNLINDDSKIDWRVSLYPNPVDAYLNVEFILPEAKDFIIKLTDITGRILMVQEARTIYPDEIFELNMSELSPALYLLHISTQDQQTRKIYRTQKI